MIHHLGQNGHKWGLHSQDHLRILTLKFYMEESKDTGECLKHHTHSSTGFISPKDKHQFYKKKEGKVPYLFKLISFLIVCDIY